MSKRYQWVVEVLLASGWHVEEDGFKTEDAAEAYARTVRTVRQNFYAPVRVRYSAEDTHE